MSEQWEMEAPARGVGQLQVSLAGGVVTLRLGQTRGTAKIPDLVVWRDPDRYGWVVNSRPKKRKSVTEVAFVPDSAD